MYKHNNMTIKARGIINVRGDADKRELNRVADELEDGEYSFFILDKKNNPSLPMMQYINGVLLSEISKKMLEKGESVSIDTLYAYFEQKYSDEILEKNGWTGTVRYHNMKKLKTAELSIIANKIKEWGEEVLGITFPSREEMKLLKQEEKALVMIF